MYAVPDVDEVVAVAKELGIHLSPEEAVLYRKHLMEQMSQLDAFVQARVEEPRPPMVLGCPDTRPAAERRRRPTQCLDMEVPDRGSTRRLAEGQDGQLQGTTSRSPECR